MGKVDYKEEASKAISYLCRNAESDGADAVGRWVVNNLKLTDEQYEMLNEYLYDEYGIELSE